ncbi:YciI family protein [uncultured Paludibaculum sp.]|uniref:YciI family protein n=1 Tax=uncultured Paludibaculum sp. TaxID=1765020 RepID=UPI002AAA8E28|nr:YciI family protein [uncultured Paludibaculum sp.]
MMMIKATQESEAGLPPNPELMAAVGKLTEEGVRSGVVVAAGGLSPSSQGARVQAKNGALAILDGPFAETKELIAGFAILEAKTREEAIEQGCIMMQLHLATLGPSYEGECEIRPMFGADVCPAASAA